jgi:RNA polymerase-binding transcription factor DksA
MLLMTKLPPRKTDQQARKTGQQVGQRDHCEECGDSLPPGGAWLANSDAAHGGFTVCEECHREIQEAIEAQRADDRERGLYG